MSAQLAVVSGLSTPLLDCQVAAENAYQDSGSSPPSSQNLLDVREAAALLGVSETWVRRHQHELPTVRAGRLCPV